MTTIGASFDALPLGGRVPFFFLVTVVSNLPRATPWLLVLT